MATTKEMVALEAKMIAFAKDGRGRNRPLGDPERPCSRNWFNDGQKAAVRHVLSSRDRVMIIRGVAGTGKTTLEQEIGEALAEAGKPVVAIAQSVKASREVLREEAGFATADTVARFLKDKDMQEAARGGVILVDEASQLGTKDMLAVFDVAEQFNARVILVGDKRQHRSVTAGEPLKLLEERAGLRVAEVTEILRQQGDYKKAAKALAKARRALPSRSWISSAGSGKSMTRSVTGIWPTRTSLPPRRRNPTVNTSPRWLYRRLMPRQASSQMPSATGCKPRGRSARSTSSRAGSPRT